MRVLLPEPVDPADRPVDLHEHYAARWLDDGGLRVNFIASVDGAASVADRSAGLQTPGDNAVFAALRDLADVVLVGAGTAVAEGYGPVRISARRAAIRQRYGLSPQLPVAIMSRSLRLDPAGPLFVADATRPLILTCDAAPVERRAALDPVADVVSCGADTVDPRTVRRALEARGLRHILSEGGPTAFADLTDAGVVDELCLTYAPLLGGPGAPRIVAGAGWADPRTVTLDGLLEEDGGLFARYRVR